MTGGEHGIHLVALFDPSCNSDEVKALLGSLGILPEFWGRDEAVSTMSPSDAIDAIGSHGGIACAAHGSSSKGLFNDMRGQQRVPLARHSGLLAVELSSLDSSTARVLRDPQSGYGRAFALYQASDAHKADDLGTRFTYFKMGEITLGALKQCFYDPDTRIRRMDTPPPEVEGYRIERVAFNGGFLDGQSIRFHSGLNCILGGKGVGKSLVIEFIRFALNQACTKVKDIKQDHREKLKSCLGIGGEVEIQISTGEDSSYTVSRTLDKHDSPIRVQHNGFDIGDASPSELFPILAYSQNEAISVSRNHRAQLSLVDGFVDSTTIVREQDAYKEALQALDIDLAASMSAAGDLRAQRRAVATCQAQLADIEAKIENPVFAEMKIWESVRDHINESTEFATRVESILREARASLQALVPGKESTIEKHGVEFANDILARATSIKQNARIAIEKAEHGAAKERRVLDESLQRFNDAIGEVRDRYLAAIEQGGDQEDLERERDRLSVELRDLQEEQRRLEQLAQRQSDIVLERSSLLAKLDAAANELFQRRNQKYKEITAQSNGKIRLSIERAADNSRFQKRLEVLSTGTMLRKVYMAQIAAAASPADFVASIIEGDSAKVASWCEMSREQADNFIGFLLSLQDRRQLLSLSYEYESEDKPRIEYRKPDGEYAEIARLSVGQKCSALVMIALADQGRTVVMDQPEDSLDVISVYDDVSRTLRSGKDSRQFIVTTHNPNVAVTSDTDMYHVVNADANKGWIDTSAAMDADKLRGRVMQQLEGGPEAYQLRRKKYEG